MQFNLKIAAVGLTLAFAQAKYSNDTSNLAADMVYETDVSVPSNFTTIQYGEVYVDDVKPTRVSATTSTYTIISNAITNTDYFFSATSQPSLGVTTGVDPSLYSITDGSTSASAISFISGAAQSASESDPTAVAQSGSDSDPTYSAEGSSNTQSIATAATDKFSASSAARSSSSGAVLGVTTSDSDSAATRSSSVSAATQLLTETTSTSTTIIYSSSASVSSPTGTIVTSLSSKPEQPLVTVSMSTSDLSTTITTSTLTSARTISTSNLLTALSSQNSSTSTSTSELPSSTTSTSSLLAQNSSTSYSVTSSVHTTTYVTAVTSVQGNTTVISSSSATSTLTLVSSIEVSSNETSTSSSIDTASTSASSSILSSSSSATSTTTAAAASTTVDLFEAVDTSEPPTVFSRNANPMDLASGVSNNDSPYETNKFYTNLMLGDQSDPAYVYPYTLWQYSSNSIYGFAVSHTTSSQYVYGNYDSNGNSEYLVNPVGIASLIFSASSFGSSNFDMYVGDMTTSSCDVTINDGDSSNILEIPLVQGMGFTTGIYHGSLVPQIQTAAAFTVLEQLDSDYLAEGILKYRVTLNSDVQWLLYVTLPEDYTSSSFELEMSSSSVIAGSESIDGLIVQFAVAPSNSTYEVYYDEAAGMYATSFELSGTSDGTTASYAFEYQLEGMSASGKTMLFALPHHIGGFTSDTEAAMTGIELQSTTKGTMQGLLTTSFEFSETLNTQIGWLPWTSQLGDTSLSYSADLLQKISEAANDELQVDIESSISGLNTYYLGKVIDKYAYILLTVAEIVQDSSVANSTLENLKEAFELLFANDQLYPLYYDTKFGGIVSSGDWASTSTSYDFGNTYYNDHHFHYGYIVHAAAAVGYVDAQLGGTWAEDNKQWVNALVRDVANPSSSDSYFPVSRMFDWFQGHSWAAGLFENANGKNEESSSEDYNFAYGMKMWGSVIGDTSMERRADVMIAIMERSMNDYFLYSDDNTVEPSEIIGNKVSGILFDNEIDYTTYFGDEVQYINGIHMLPITPVSSAMRGPEFVSEEWSEKLSSIVGDLTDGWLGVLTLNEALFDPLASYEFFSSSSFSSSYLDDGMSLTWSLAFSGGLAYSLGQL